MATSTGTISTSAGPLDVATLVNQLISVESKSRLTPLKNKESSFNTLISAYGSLKNAFTSYQSALKTLTAASFSAQKTTLSNAGTGTNLTTDPFTADTNTDESTKVLAQKLQSAGFTPARPSTRATRWPSRSAPTSPPSSPCRPTPPWPGCVTPSMPPRPA